MRHHRQYKIHLICRKIFRKGFCDIIIIWIVASALSFADLSYLDPTRLIDNFTGSHNRFTTKTFFEIKNYGYVGDNNPSQIFALVDIKDLTSRARIAALIDSVYKQEPQRIAVDIMFETPQDSLADMSLIKTVRRVRDKTTFACILNNYLEETQSFDRIQHSFFLNPDYEEWFCDSVTEGYTNMKNDGTNETIWQYSLVEQVDKRRIYSLPATLLNDYPDEEPHTTHIINYDKLQIPLYTPDSITRENIEGKFVIIGAFKHSGDKFDTPLGLIPGMLIHTYIMQSQNTDSIFEESATDNITRTLIVILLFIVLLIIFDALTEFVSNSYLSLFLKGGFFTIFMTISAIYLLMYYYYRLFAVEGIFSDGHAAINGILIASALVKTFYATTIAVLHSHNKLLWLTRCSLYGQFKQ